MTAQPMTLRPVRLAAVGLVFLAACANRPKSDLRPMPTELRSRVAPVRSGRLSLDTSIEAICATPAGKAVLDHDLPGLTGRPEFAMFKAMTLKQLQPLSRGGITQADLTKVQSDLEAVSPSHGGK